MSQILPMKLPMEVYFRPPLNMGPKGFNGHLRKKYHVKDPQNENVILKLFNKII